MNEYMPQLSVVDKKKLVDQVLTIIKNDCYHIIDNPLANASGDVYEHETVEALMEYVVLNKLANR